MKLDVLLAHLHRLMHNQDGSPRMPLLAAMLIIYSALEMLLIIKIGTMATAMVALPTMFTAWMTNRRVGLITATLLSVFNLLAILVVRPEQGIALVLLSSLAGWVLVLILALLASWAAEQNLHNQRELVERKQMEARLRESEERYRMMFHAASDAILVFDLQGELLECNQVICDWLGYASEQLIAMNLMEIETIENANHLPKRIATLQLDEEALYESAFARNDGTILPVELHARMIEYLGKPAVFSIARDISKRKAMETTEREQRVLADALHDIAADLTGTLQLEEVLDRILKSSQRVIHHDAASIMMIEDGQVFIEKQRGGIEQRTGTANDVRQATPLEDMPLQAQMMQSGKPLIVSDVRASAYWNAFRGTTGPRSYAGVPIVLKGETIGFLNIESNLPNFFKQEHAWRLQAFANHTAIAIQNARLYTHVQQLAQVDELTGLYNRRGLITVAQRELDSAIRYKRPLSVLLIDIDNFKLFNDQYNYSVGDEILSAIAQRVRSNVRQDDLVSRWGGDEFVVALLESDRDPALLAAEHVRQAIHQTPFETSQGPITVTVSIGVCALDQAHQNLNDMIHAAGDGLHQAKQNGRNRVK